MKILVLNSGSSSQKSALFEIHGQGASDPIAPLWQAKIEWGGPQTELSIRAANGSSLRSKVSVSDRHAAIERMLETLWDGKSRVLSNQSEIEAVGHRVVHGGPHLTQPIRITSEVKSTIQAIGEFAPLHSGAELEGINIIERLLGSVPQIAVFDTGFHRTLPRVAAQYPGPYEWFEQGIRRYGFHGINHQYCAQRAAQLLQATPDSLRTDDGHALGITRSRHPHLLHA
jgi:acetate kinase